MNFIRVKKGFTLVELIIVIFITLSTYFLIFSNSNFKVKDEEIKLSLHNLREVLIKNFEFKDEISFICIEDNLQCFFSIDGKIDDKNSIKHFFTTKPLVYEYSKKEKLIDFNRIDINDSIQDVVFELKINNDYKTNEFILDTLEDKVYVFNSIYKEPKIFDSLRDVLDFFEKNELEVRDAF